MPPRGAAAALDDEEQRSPHGQRTAPIRAKGRRDRWPSWAHDEPLPRPGAKAVGSAPPVCRHSPSARRVSFRARADRFNPCESGSNPLRLGLEVLQPPLQPLANGPDRLRRATGTSLLHRGEVVGQKSEQLEQGHAGIRDVVVRPLRRVNGNPCQQRIPELLEAEDVEFRRRFRHGAILPQSRSRSLPLAPLVRYCSSTRGEERKEPRRGRLQFAQSGRVRCLVIPRAWRA